MQNCISEIGRGRARALFFGVAGSLMAFSGPAMAAGASKSKAAEPQDRQAVLSELRMACATGGGEACYTLAKTYELRRDLWGRPVKGDGVQRNNDQALRYFRLACEHGYGKACVSLGRMYESGKGVRKSAGKAKQLFRRACVMGASDACRKPGVQPSFNHLRD